MSVNMSRSMNQELREGATDGSLKKAHKYRGGVVESATDEALSLLHGNINGYGVADGTSLEGTLTGPVL